ncbi:MAG: VCBS repeat-containing protein, partial [Flavobacteriales bacterium]|nr:VCBS repeat-containing protein [Flavobacteriales bacterium]
MEISTILRTSSLVFLLFPALLSAQVAFGPEQHLGWEDDSEEVKAIDIDGDGHLDVIWMGYQETVNWRMGDGTGNFGSTDDISLPWGYGGLTLSHFDLGDMDGDGDLDLILAGGGDLGIELRLYENIDGENFGWEYETLHVEDTYGDAHIDVEDMNNDGNPDIVVGYYAADKIAWIVNEGNGVFFEQQTIATFINGPDKVLVAELAGSGNYPEIISGMTGGYGAYWFENDYGISFMSNNFSGIINQPRKYGAADLDGDGDIDVMLTYGNNLIWYENNGNGTFGGDIEIAGAGIYANNITPADLDDDGDVDIILGRQYDDPIRWYENNGDGTFDNYHEIEPSSYSNFTAVGDLDEDGYLDLICTSAASGDVFWFENLSSIGCMDSSACNYDELALEDDGSCCYTDCGCTNPLAINFDSTASCNNGSCQFQITGTVFNDANSDGIWDPEELPLALQEVQIPNLSLTSITNDDGVFSFLVGEGEFQVELTTSIAFPFITTPSVITVVAGVDDTSELVFGLSYFTPAFAICVDLYPTGGGFLCDDQHRHNICFRNMGSVPINGVVEVEYDPLFQGHVEVTPIDSTDGNTVYMSYADLQPGEMFFYDLDLLTPTTDYLGEY